jgi:integrase
MARRSRGDGSVYYDAARGCWVGAIDLGRDPETRRRVRRKVSAPTKTACRDLLDELRSQFRATGTVPRRDTTVRQLVADWLAHPPPSVRSPITVQVHANAGRKITDALGHVRGVALTPGQVEDLLAGMARDGYATRTIAATRSVLVHALRRGERNGLLTRNVAALVPVPRGTRRTSRALTDAEVSRLLALGLTPWWRAWITTAVMTGLRPGELLGLAWEDVDLAAGVVRVRASIKAGKDENGRTVLRRESLKTERSRRTLELPAAVRAVLAVLRREQAAERLAAGPAYTDHGLVFCGPSGQPQWRQSVNAQFKALCERAGIGAGLTARATRHTFVSLLSDSNVSVERIADAVGHVNSNVTRAVYRHQLADTVADAAAVMDSRFKETGPS